MVSPPPPLSGVASTAQDQDDCAPTQRTYLPRLHHECQRQGLNDENDELTFTDTLRACPREPDMGARPLRHTDLTKEQWADPSDPINAFEHQDLSDPFDDSDWDTQTVDRAQQQHLWDETRETTVEHHDASSQRLSIVSAKTMRDFLTAGKTQQRLDDIQIQHPTDATIHDQLQGQNQPAHVLGLKQHEDPTSTLAVMVFSDIPPEDTKLVRCQISYHETWSGFTATMAQQYLVRYLVTKHHPPSIADALFVDDDTIWPPEGVLPFRDEDDNIVNPEQDHARRADLVYDNGPGRGWWASVVPKRSPRGLLGLHTEWRALDTAADWDSLMKWLDAHRDATAVFRHESTKERSEFVKDQRAKEDTALGFPGYRPFNLYLDRHMREVDQRQLYGPLREEAGGELSSMQVPEGSERLQSAASREIDALLKEWGIEKVEIDLGKDEGEAEGNEGERVEEDKGEASVGDGKGEGGTEPVV